MWVVRAKVHKLCPEFHHALSSNGGHPNRRILCPLKVASVRREQGARGPRNMRVQANRQATHLCRAAWRTSIQDFDQPINASPPSVGRIKLQVCQAWVTRVLPPAGNRPVPDVLHDFCVLPLLHLPRDVRRGMIVGLAAPENESEHRRTSEHGPQAVTVGRRRGVLSGVE
jgi:hypothetical protein